MVKLPSDQKTDDARLQTPGASATGGQVRQKIDTSLSFSGPGLTTKEKEILARQEEVALEEVRKELEIAPEVKEAGVEVQKEEIELPPPLPRMGVTQTGAELPVSVPAAIPPLTDDKIVTGLGAPILASLRWLVEWCLKQLKKAHVKLKKVHGRIIRVVTK